MAEFVIDLGGIGDQTREIFDRIDSAADDVMGFALTVIAKEAKLLAPKGSTGALALSIRAGHVTGSFSGGSLSGEILADAPHAAAHEYGSGLHGEKAAKYPILPKNRKALRWPGQGFIGPVAPSIQGVKGTAAAKSSSGFVFSRGVMHPGVRASGYLAHAMEAKLPKIEKQLAAAIATAILGPQK